MSRNTQLGALITMLRAEIRHSPDPALGQNFRTTLVQTLSRTQQRLYDETLWKFLIGDRFVTLQTGQRYYAFPSDLNFDRVQPIAKVRWSAQWVPIQYGIEASEYNMRDSDAGVTQDPVYKWQLHEDGNWEAWPIPATNGAALSDGRVWFRGCRTLKPLLADTDTADLDDMLIVLYAAAELLMARADGAKDAKIKAKLADDRYRQLKANQSKGGGVTVIGGGLPNSQDRARVVRVTYSRAV